RVAELLPWIVLVRSPGCPPPLFLEAQVSRNTVSFRPQPSTLFIHRASPSYNCDTISRVEKAISIRLDEEAQEALRALTGSGRSQSEAVREAIVELARRGRRGDLVAEAKRLSVDRDDRAEKARVTRLMESLRAAG